MKKKTKSYRNKQSNNSEFTKALQNRNTPENKSSFEEEIPRLGDIGKLLNFSSKIQDDVIQNLNVDTCEKINKLSLKDEIKSSLLHCMNNGERRLALRNLSYDWFSKTNFPRASDNCYKLLCSALHIPEISPDSISELMFAIKTTAEPQISKNKDDDFCESYSIPGANSEKEIIISHGGGARHIKDFFMGRVLPKICG